MIYCKVEIPGKFKSKNITKKTANSRRFFCGILKQILKGQSK